MRLKEAAKKGSLISVATALILLGYHLIKAGDYGHGVPVVVIGVAVGLFYYLLEKGKLLDKEKIKTLIGTEMFSREGAGIMVFSISFGIALHDFCHALYEVGGHTHILTPQGGYFGFAGIIIGFLILALK